MVYTEDLRERIESLEKSRKSAQNWIVTVLGSVLNGLTDEQIAFARQHAREYEDGVPNTADLVEGQGRDREGVYQSPGSSRGTGSGEEADHPRSTDGEVRDGG